VPSVPLSSTDSGSADGRFSARSANEPAERL
jgi:hypothetical protein